MDEIIKQIINRIKDVASPVKIILFGSAARDEMKPDSDLDILVIVPPGTHRRKTARKIYRNLVGVGFATDIIVVTEDDVIQYRNHPGIVIKQALDEGKVLYAA